MPIKIKALVIAILSSILSIIVMVSISWFVAIIGSSTLATALAVFVWGFIIYKLTLVYLVVQKEID